MIREVSLIEYLPLFVQDYSEIQKIMTAENPEFKLLWDWNEKIRDNVFITTAGEIGIKRYERMLGIRPFPDDTLELRRARIIIRINEQLPYTMRTLHNMLDAICGEGNFEVQLDADNYLLKVRLEIFSNHIADSVFVMLANIVPANLICILSNDTVQLVELFYSGAMTQAMTHKLSVSVDLTDSFEINESGQGYTPMNGIFTQQITQKTKISI